MSAGREGVAGGGAPGSGTRTLAARLVSGAGNRFVLVDALAGSLPEDPTALARELGARAELAVDGLLVLAAPRAGGAVRMIVFNKDGSRPQACGNGLRCLARHALERGHAAGPELVVETDAGPRRVRADGEGLRVELGPARVVGRPVLDTPLGPLAVVAVDVGNPHAVLFAAPGEEPWSAPGNVPGTADVRALGPLLERHAYFPEGANVELASAGPRGLAARVWERGVGETAACGTGAVAVAVAARGSLGLALPLAVAMPGGTLVVSGDPEEAAWLAGPVRLLGAVALDGAPGP